MNDFTASNGVTVSTSSMGIFVSHTLRAPALSILADSYIEALREFFQAEADERLGRWRWPENPDYVAIPRERTDTPRETRRVRVIHEPSGDFMDTVEGSSLVGVFKDAARAYFDAHPEPKPWHGAKPGEVWELTLEGEDPAAFYPSKSMDGCFTPVMPNTGTTAVNFDWPLITAGRRIWPEVT